MVEGFTQKEMLVRVMNKLDNIDGKFDKFQTKLNETHVLASNTNGKVKFHTKIIFSLCGILVTSFLAFGGWIVSAILK